MSSLGSFQSKLARQHANKAVTEQFALDVAVA